MNMEKIKANWQKYALGTAVLIIIFVGGILIGKIACHCNKGPMMGRPMMENFQGRGMNFDRQNWKKGDFQKNNQNLNNQNQTEDAPQYEENQPVPTTPNQTQTNQNKPSALTPTPTAQPIQQ